MACNLKAIEGPIDCNYFANQWYNTLSNSQRKRLVSQVVETVRAAEKRKTPEAAAQRPDIDTITPILT